MTVDTRPGRVHLASLAGALAALSASLAVTLSAPAVTRPLAPALAILVLAPAAFGATAAFLASWLPGVGRRAGATAAGAVLGCLPWLAVAAAPIARHPIAAPLAGLVAALVLGLVLARRRRAWACGALIAAAVVPMLRSNAIELAGERSVVVLGFDAATWDQIDPMIAAGELGEFERLRRLGASGVLESEELSQSPRVWTTIATGVPPEVHGILSFGFDRSYLAAGRVWDEVVEKGAGAGVLGWLVNSPPDATLDFSLPGWLSPGAQTVPAEAGFLPWLEKALLDPGKESRAERYLNTESLVHLLDIAAVSSARNLWRFADDARRLAFDRPEEKDREWRVKLLIARLETDLFLELLTQYGPQFGALVTYPTDSLGHRYWQYHEPGLDPDVTPDEIARWGEVVRDAYRTADETLRRVAARLDLERTTLIVVSDHGMEGVPLDARHLVIRSAALLETLGMRDALRATLSVRNLVLAAKTPGAEGEAALARAEALLAAAAFEGRDATPFHVVRPEIHRDVVVVQMAEHPPGEERIRIGPRAVSVADLCSPESFSSDHTTRGVLVLVGPGIRPSARVDAMLEDVAPTVLYALGLAIPEALTGRVALDAFEPRWIDANAPRVRPGAMTRPDDVRAGAAVDEAASEGALRALGYVR